MVMTIVIQTGPWRSPLEREVIFSGSTQFGWRSSFTRYEEDIAGSLAAKFKRFMKRYTRIRGP